MQRGCHFGTDGSGVSECRFRLLDYGDVPDGPGDKKKKAYWRMIQEIKGIEIHRIKRRRRMNDKKE
jgi:hypothetical protein